MKINVPQIDYLRLTTFDKFEFERIKSHVDALHDAEDFTPGKIDRYEGFWSGGIFLGEGIQKERLHWFMQFSGETADTFNGLIGPIADGKCTRLDCQVTVPLPAGYSARLIADSLRVSLWPGKQRLVYLMEDTGPFESVYIGSLKRKSGRLIRIYVKEAGGDVPLALRFEVEYSQKHEYSIRAYNAFWGRHKGGEAYTAGQLVKREFELLPWLELPAWQSIAKALPDSNGDIGAQPKHVPEPSHTAKWLRKSVHPAIIRMIHDHTYGPAITNWLMELALYGTEFWARKDEELNE